MKAAKATENQLGGRTLSTRTKPMRYLFADSFVPYRGKKRRQRRSVREAF
jgi:hypothetical protein